MWFGERTQFEWQNYGNDVGGRVGEAPIEGVRYLGDESFSQRMNGCGPAERNRSTGETGANDGRQITLDGVAYAKGIGVHSDSQLFWLLHGQCSTFQAVIGVDDEVGAAGSVIFQVLCGRRATVHERGHDGFDSGPERPGRCQRRDRAGALRPLRVGQLRPRSRGLGRRESELPVGLVERRASRRRAVASMSPSASGPR
jgi:NPCBM/NEW2 domain